MSDRISILTELYNRQSLPSDKMAILRELEERGSLDAGLNKLSQNEEFISSLKQEQPQEEVVQRSLPQELGRQAGLTARAGVEGVSDLAGVAYDPIASVMNKVLPEGYKIPPLNEQVEHWLDRAGVPKPEGTIENLTNQISRAMVGAATGIGAAGKVAKGATGITQSVAKSMAAQPGQQIAGAIGSVSGQQAAEEAGLGVVGQVAGALGGGVIGAGTAGKISRSLGPKNVPEGLVEAEKRGMRVLTEDVFPAETGGGRISQNIRSKILGGSGKQRALQQAERTKASQDFIAEYGADIAPGDEGVKGAIEKVYEQMVKKRSFKLKKYNKLKTDVIEKLDSKGSVPVTKTIKKIDAEIENIKGFNEDSPLIPFYEKFKNKLQNKSMTNIEELRKDLGDELKGNADLASVQKRGEKVARKIYKKLNEDMGEFIKKNGDPKDYNKWQAGNANLSKMMNELEVGALKTTLKNGDATPETVRKMLFSTKPSEMRLLYKNLPPEGKRNAQTALIQEALWKTSKGRIEELSPDIFKNKLRDLSKQTGVFFTGQDKQAIDGLYKALRYTEAAGKAVAAPATGVQNLPVFLMTLMGSAGAGGAVMAGGGPYSAAIGALAVPTTIGGLSRGYNSKPIRNLLIHMSRAKKGSSEEMKVAKRLLAVLQDTFKEKEEPVQ